MTREVWVLGRHSNVVGGIISQACSCLLVHLLQHAVLCYLHPYSFVLSFHHVHAAKSYCTGSEVIIRCSFSVGDSRAELLPPTSYACCFLGGSECLLVNCSIQFATPWFIWCHQWWVLLYRLWVVCWVAAAEVPPLAVLQCIVLLVVFFKFRYVYFYNYYYHYCCCSLVRIHMVDLG